MKNFNVRNTSSDSKRDHRASKQKRLQGNLPLHKLGDFEKIHTERSTKKKK